MSTLRWGAATDTGLVRTANEDSFVTESPVFAVADGMGGHLAGEVASEMAVSTLRRRLVESTAPNDVATIVDAVRRANVEINEAASASADRRGMGTTLTALAVLRSNAGEQLALVNVGDSRAYVLRAGRLQQLSIDHSYVQELIASGQLDPADARHHPHRNIVTRALGIDRTVQVDAWTMPLVTGDRFLLCSDGLVDEVIDETIAELLASTPDPQVAAERLVATANRHGGRDNTTVVIVDVVAGVPSSGDHADVDPEPHWAAAAAAAAATATGAGSEDDAGAQTVADVHDLDEPAGAEAFAAPLGAPVGAAMRLDDPGEPSDVTGPLRRPVGPATMVATPVMTDVKPGTPAVEQEPRRRGARLTIPMIIFLTAVVGVFVVAFVMTAAYARSGYFLGFNADNAVTVYKGRPDGLLWFDPTIEAITLVGRDQLPAGRAAIIERHPTFDSVDKAVAYVDGIAPSTTTTTTPDTTTAPTDVTATTSVTSTAAAPSSAPASPETSGP